MIKNATFLLLALASALIAKGCPLTEIHQYGDALNMEGAIISQRCLQPGQQWANICFVLDRPLQEGIDLDEITQENPFPLKEASLEHYNEVQAAYLIALISRYYLAQGKKMILQVHRNSSAPNHLAVIEQALDSCLDCAWRDQLEFRSGYRPYDTYDGADLILSVSMVAGLHPEWQSGTALLPTIAIPFDLHSMVLAVGGAYPTKNQLIDEMDAILATQDAAMVERINEAIRSPNPDKEHLLGHIANRDELKEARLLQVNGMFYPKQMWNLVDVIR